MSTTIQDDDRKETLISLLVLSALPNTEKELWFGLIPNMTEEEDNRLLESLEAQLTYEYNAGKKAGEQLAKN